MTPPPRLATCHDRDYCAAGAAHLLREREAKYPALITAGKLTVAAGALALERTRAIVAQWRWVMDPAGPIDPPWDEDRGVYGFGGYDFELEDELLGAVRRSRTIADRDPASAQKAVVADLCEALAWWQGRDPGTSTCRIVRDTISARRCAATIAAQAVAREAA